MCEDKNNKEERLYVESIGRIKKEISFNNECSMEAARRRKERDIIIAQWMNEEIDCDEMSKRINDIKYYVK